MTVRILILSASLMFGATFCASAAPRSDGFGAWTEGYGFKRGEYVYAQHDPIIGCRNTGMRLALEKRMNEFRRLADWQVRLANVQCFAVPIAQKLTVAWVEAGTVKAWSADQNSGIPPLWYMPGDLGKDAPGIESE